MARLNVGEKVVVMFYNIEGSRRFYNPLFLPWQDKLKDIKLAVLTVTEAHKVAWDQDPEQEKKYDGYVLTDMVGARWANQYPSYSQGQVSTADSYFNHLHAEGTKYEDLSDLQLAHFEDVCVVLDRIENGIRDLSGVPKTHHLAEQLQVHLNWLTKKLEKETGAKTDRVPVWNDCPDIQHTVLVWPEVK